jgi:hypothetical protein
MSSLFINLFIFLVIKYWSICLFSFNTCLIHLSFSLTLWYNIIDFLVIYLRFSYLYIAPPLFHCLTSSLIIILIQALLKYFHAFSFQFMIALLFHFCKFSSTLAPTHGHTFLLMFFRVASLGHAPLALSYQLQEPIFYLSHLLCYCSRLHRFAGL